MKRISLLLVSFCLAHSLLSQPIEKIIKPEEVLRIETMLASDEMQGRRTFTPGIDKAAAFIAAEFAAMKIEPYPGTQQYLQTFSMLRPKFLGVTARVNGLELDAKNVVVVTCKDTLHITEQSGYEQVKIAAGENLSAQARKFINAKKNYIVLVDSSFAANFNMLTRFKSQLYQSNFSTVFILSAQPILELDITATHSFTRQTLQNVAAIIPGKSRPNEYVIFSGHYDHLGVMSKDRQGNVLTDSIFNGANDDAAGTTAMLMLAKYFSKVKENDRTLIFVAFTAEEVGGFGATFFSNQLNPDEIVAMFNIEMIGTESKWGKNSAYITGYEKTNMGDILQKNLEGTGFNFYPDPYTTQNLFYRSDNATLARLGVPAHTISTSKMDNEPNYHKASDEVSTLDIENMTMIIKSIALSARSIISGKDTPSRVDTKALK
ncbi:MAG: M28 family peptidase [Chitinophagia bacterium]|jgi:hypothetical protein